MRVLRGCTSFAALRMTTGLRMTMHVVLSAAKDLHVLLLALTLLAFPLFA